MTTAADDRAAEEAFEAYLAGRSVPAAGDGLVAFADAVRASAAEPGRPSGALADLLSTGLLTDQPMPSSRAVRRPRRRRSRVLASALFTKIAAAGLAAKAATLAGVAVVGLTTVGFTGNLGPAQHSFATLVDDATPFTAPDPATPPTGTGPVSPAGPTAATTTDAGTPTSGGTGDDGGSAPSTPTPFGQQVSQMAHDPADGKAGVDGSAVSSLARSQHTAGDDDAERSTATREDDGDDDATGAATPAGSTDHHGTSGSGSGGGSTGKGKSDR